MSSRYANPIVNNLLFKKDGTIETTGSVAFFEAGTSTPLAVYSDEGLTTSLGSVLDTDANGLIPDFHMAAGTKYKIVAYDAPAAGGAELWTRDDIFPIDSSVATRLDSVEATIAGLSIARNACINGGMRVALGSVHSLDATFTQGTVDELYGRVTNVTAGTLTQGSSIDYTSGKYAHFSGVTTSTSGLVEAQIRIPSNEAARFVDQQGTFSCLVYQNTGASVTYTITIKKPSTTADDFSSLATVDTSGGDAVTSATNTRLSFSVADLGDVSKGIAIEISASVGTISAREFRISEAQFEIGGTRTTFVEQAYEVAYAALAFTDSTARNLLGYPPNFASGLRIESDTDTDHDVKVNTGACRGAADDGNINLSSVITKQLDAAWAEGDDAGGLPSGVTLSGSEWLYFFVIGKADGTVDAGFDDNASATNLLADASGYTYYRFIGVVYINGSSNITTVVPVGYSNIQTLTSGTSWTVPPNVYQVKATITGAGGGGGGVGTTSSGTGSAGGNTTFNSVTATGGTGGAGFDGNSSLSYATGKTGKDGLVSSNGGGGATTDEGTNISSGSTGQDGVGGQIVKRIFSVTPLTSVSYSIGSGGTGGNNTADGGSGGDGSVILEYEVKA